MELVRWLHVQLKEHESLSTSPQVSDAGRAPSEEEPCSVGGLSQATTGTQAAPALYLASMWHTYVRWISADLKTT